MSKLKAIDNQELFTTTLALYAPMYRFGYPPSALGIFDPAYPVIAAVSGTLYGDGWASMDVLRWDEQAAQFDGDCLRFYFCNGLWCRTQANHDRYGQQAYPVWHHDPIPYFAQFMSDVMIMGLLPRNRKP